MKILGLMSGSSLDGLDMALCEFHIGKDSVVTHIVLETKQVEFPPDILVLLQNVTNFSARKLFEADGIFSTFLGNACRQFILNSKHEVDMISSHGHTVYHYPEDKYTTQLGNGGIISQIAETDVTCDFRSSDIGAGGLGAPCAPIVDQYLFPEADLLLNIGGISNITYKGEDKIKAFDISAANQLLNFLASRKGELFDKDGRWASQGTVDREVLNRMIAINDLNDTSPRALDNSWVQKHFIPIITRGKVEDLLRTSVEFINLEINKAITLLKLPEKNYSMVITGGGAFNKFLMHNLTEKLKMKNISILDVGQQMISYKEAILIALMGYLRWNRISNVLKSVTGASKDTIGGCVYVY